MKINRNLYIILVLSILMFTNDLKAQGQYQYCSYNTLSFTTASVPVAINQTTTTMINIAVSNSVTANLVAGNTYKLSTSYSSFDPVMTVFDLIGVAQAFNDDGAIGTESEINFTPLYTSTYSIQINEFGCLSGFGLPNLQITLLSEPQTAKTIPVVVHVVHYGEAIGTDRNISDAQIHNQIAVLNTDFNRLNTDIVSAPPLFRGVSANASIEFCLAQQDPNGGYTDGIVRYDASLNAVGQDSWSQAECDSIIKPNTIWNAEDYLNIWVVDLDDEDGDPNTNLLGFAKFPPSIEYGLGNSDPNIDGVVMFYKAFGTSPNNLPGYNVGRTLTHEIGHYLGLFHPHMPTCLSDGCSDTPAQEDATYGCPVPFTALSTCINFPVMYNNFMSYVNQDCMNMFTYNQKLRMQYFLATDRNTLLSSNGCTPTVPIYGCTDSTACNYDANANNDDGTCIGTSGCMDAAACNYNASATCDDGSCLTDYGCIDVTACNYDASATCDNGTCQLPDGCTDPNASNYNSLALCDDGSCNYPMTYVPSDNFEQALIDLGYDTFLDDSVITENINTVTFLNIDSLNIADLTGIEDFIALINLNCSDNQITSLDFSNNTTLSSLRCKNNQLTSLDLSQNTVLTYLYCYNNQLTSLDVSNNTALTRLRCDSNQLTNLDVSQNTALKYLSCFSNQLTSLDVSNSTALTSLSFAFNQLTSIDLSQNTVLTYLYCYNNQLTSLDLNQNTVLTYLYCDNNQLTSLDVSNNTALTRLRCGANQLTTLDVRNGNNTNMTSFDARYNSYLGCIDVDNPIFSTSSWPDIDAIASFSGSCSGFGCIDSMACNYNPYATFDDGSCLIDYGCMDASACNYDSSATCDDGSCVLPDGCTDPMACNYDSSATCDNGSCLTDYGCMDASAFNYDPIATCDDGSCIAVVDGCTDSTACNYDALANTDDGSCYNILSSIGQNGDILIAITTPISFTADWYNIQTEDSTTRIWLMEEDVSSFSPTFDCSYFIVVSDNGCIDTSAIYYYGENAARIGSFTTSPNPTSGLINVKFENAKNQFVMFELISNSGSKLDEFITIENNLDIDLSKYPSGSYYLYFNSEDAVQGCRLEEVQKVSTKIILIK